MNEVQIEMELPLPEYKEKIKLDFQIVTDTEIHISGASTSFVYTKLVQEIDINELLKKRTELIKLAKEKNIKISYKNKTLSILKCLKESYESEYVEYAFLFELLAKKSKEVLKDGIFVGYGDDHRINDLTNTRNKLDFMFVRDSALRTVNDINYSINNYIKDIENYSKIYL